MEKKDSHNIRIMVTTHPYGSINDAPIKQLHGLNVHYNDVDRRYKRDELIEKIKKIRPTIIIAGTEKYDKEILDLMSDLKLIARVGIGLDNVPLDECKKRGIIVTYTPDAPSNAVAELTICQMFNLLRRVQYAHYDILNKKWNRYIGRELRDCNVGIIGCGRIGELIIQKLQGLKPRRVFINDLIHEKAMNQPRSEYATKFQILTNCDVITIHIPHNEDNHDFIAKDEFDVMKKDVKFINTSRGGIINEKDLYDFLKQNKEAAAAIDTFDDEPYYDKLCELDNVFLTPHLGSCTIKSRFDMEVGAAEEVINYLHNLPFNNRVI